MMNKSSNMAKSSWLLLSVALPAAFFVWFSGSPAADVWIREKQASFILGTVTLLNLLMFAGFVLYFVIKKLSDKRQNTTSSQNHFLDLQADRDKAHKMKRRYRNFAEAEIHGNEAERLRIARELHDDTIHRLIILGQQIELIKYDNPDSPLIEELDELIKIADQGIDHIRGVIKELRPSYLAKRGLIPAVRGLIKEKAGRMTTTLDLVVEGEEYRLSDEVELIVYRLAQTALQNVRLHSQSTKASVTLSFQRNQITLVVKDNGIGFDVPNEADLFDNGHFGLLGMRERTQLCNGSFNIHSIKGSGTRITAEIPRESNLPQHTPYT